MSGTLLAKGSGVPSIGSFVRLGVVVAAAAATSATSVLCEEVDRIENRSFFVSESDPERRDALEACLNSDFACTALCDDLLGVPEPGYTRTIRECYLIEEGTGYRVNTQYRLTGPCYDDYVPDAYWFPDAAQQPDAAPPDAHLLDATAPDAAL
jgi:hypothetical protein